MDHMIIHGEVVRVEPALGFGFIHDDGLGDWFFVDAGVRSGAVADLWVGARVAFIHERTASGPRAADVHHESAE